MKVTMKGISRSAEPMHHVTQLVPDRTMMHRRALGYEWKRKARVGRLRSMTIGQATREVEDLLGLFVSRQPVGRPLPPARRFILK